MLRKLWRKADRQQLISVRQVRTMLRRNAGSRSTAPPGSEPTAVIFVRWGRSARCFGIQFHSHPRRKVGCEAC